MALTVQNVYGLVLRSKLLPPDEAKAMLQRWQEEAKGGGDLDRFRGWLVANRYLTEYQAKLLCRGQADGFILGQYKILDRLGRGESGRVYKAAHNLGQVVAIKVLPPSRAKDAQVAARFQREARGLLQLKHPHVARAFQLGEAGGVSYLVLEYLEGETLDETLRRRGKLPPHEAVRLVHQALLGLQHIHEKGMTHGDLHPANLMVVPARPPGGPDTTLRSTVKVLNAGLGPAFPDQISDRAAYRAPEQAGNPDKADIRSDIYSLGCVLYHALAGRPPSARDVPRPLMELNPEVPDGLQQIVNWMTARDPGRRYPTPERAAQALEVYLAAGAEPAATAEDGPHMRSYLTWLEKDSAGTAPAPAPAGAATSVDPKSAVAEWIQEETRSKATPVPAPRKPRARPERPAVPVAAPVAPPSQLKAAEPGHNIDVELVPGAPPASRPGDEVVWARLGLTRRDCLMLAIGAGGALFAGGLGGLIAFLRNRNKRIVEAGPEAAGENKEQ
jgi:serine/threonine protein kinase